MKREPGVAWNPTTLVVGSISFRKGEKMAVLTDNQIYKVHEFMTTYGYSRKECSEMAGVSLSTFNRALRKDDKLRKPNIDKIISILGNYKKPVNMSDIEDTFNSMDEQYTKLLEEAEDIEGQIMVLQSELDEKKEKLKIFEQRNCRDLRETNRFEEVTLELEGD